MKRSSTIRSGRGADRGLTVASDCRALLAGALALLLAAALSAAGPQSVLAQDSTPDAPVQASPAETPGAQAEPAAPESASESGTGAAGTTSGAQPGSTGAGDGTGAEESAPPAAAGQQAPAAGPLVVVSWGGVYSKSQDEAVLRPFTRNHGIRIDSKVYAGDLDQLRDQAAAGAITWDVIDVDPAEAEAGCNEGLLEKISVVLPAAPDGTSAKDDFLPGTLHPCGVGSLAWSMVIAHRLGSESDREGDARPDSLADFFDLSTFPGRRALRRTPMANLEWALLADGVAPDRVYDLLRSEAGVARAFAKLDTIRDSLVWWEDADEPAKLLNSGEVVMASTYNAPAFNDIAVRGLPLDLIWDGQIWDIDLWAIPANAPRRDAALEFLRFATGTEPLARQTRWIPYGPVRRSSIALVTDYVYSETKPAPYLPTAPENLESALRNDALFWREQGQALVERFNDWLAR
jgi:putative spermidine/putrescine transport system substrate-binding protein